MQSRIFYDNLEGYRCADNIKDQKPENNIAYSVSQGLKSDQAKPLTLSIREFGFYDLTEDIKEFRKLKNLEVLTLPNPSLKSDAIMCFSDKVYMENLKLLSSVIPEVVGLKYLMVYKPDSIFITSLIKSGNLKSLRISSIRNERLPMNIDQLVSLKHLSISGGLRSGECIFPKTIFNMTNLESLFLPLHHDSICDSVSTLLGNLKNLKKLFFFNTGYDSVPESIGQLTKLEWLFVSQSYIPSSIGNLTKLKTLNIRNRDPHIPQQIGSLTNLEELVILDYRTGRPELPSTLSNLSKLKILYMRGHVPKSQNENGIPQSVYKLQNLEGLWITGLDVARISHQVQNLKSLKTIALYAGGTISKKQTDVLKGLKNLETLAFIYAGDFKTYYHSNTKVELEDLQWIKSLPRFNTLYLLGIEIDEELSWSGVNSKITELLIDRHSFKGIEKNLKSFSRLKKLIIISNGIEGIQIEKLKNGLKGRGIQIIVERYEKFRGFWYSKLYNSSAS